MRSLLLSCAFALLTTIGFSQNAEPSLKVKQGLTSAELQSTDSNRMNYLNYYSSNSYVVHPEAKSTEGIPMLSSVLKSGKTMPSGETLNQENFNPLEYDVTPLPEESQFFLVDGTNKVVQFYSKALIDMQYGRFITNERNRKAIGQ